MEWNFLERAKVVGWHEGKSRQTEGKKGREIFYQRPLSLFLGKCQAIIMINHDSTGLQVLTKFFFFYFFFTFHDRIFLFFFLKISFDTISFKRFLQLQTFSLPPTTGGWWSIDTSSATNVSV